MKITIHVLLCVGESSDNYKKDRKWQDMNPNKICKVLKYVKYVVLKR